MVNEDRVARLERRVRKLTWSLGLAVGVVLILTAVAARPKDDEPTHNLLRTRSLVLIGGDGAPTATLGPPSKGSGCGLVLYDAHLRPRMVMSLDGQGAPSIACLRENGEDDVRISVDDTSGSVVVSDDSGGAAGLSGGAAFWRYASGRGLSLSDDVTKASIELSTITGASIALKSESPLANPPYVAIDDGSLVTLVGATGMHQSEKSPLVK